MAVFQRVIRFSKLKPSSSINSYSFLSSKLPAHQFNYSRISEIVKPDGIKLYVDKDALFQHLYKEEERIRVSEAERVYAHMSAYLDLYLKDKKMEAELKKQSLGRRYGISNNQELDEEKLALQFEEFLDEEKLKKWWWYVGTGLGFSWSLTVVLSSIIYRVY